MRCAWGPKTTRTISIWPVRPVQTSLVRRIRGRTARVADGGRDDAGGLPEEPFGAPEAAHAELGDFAAVRVRRPKGRTVYGVTLGTDIARARPGRTSLGAGKRILCGSTSQCMWASLRRARRRIRSPPGRPAGRAGGSAVPNNRGMTPERSRCLESLARLILRVDPSHPLRCRDRWSRRRRKDDPGGRACSADRNGPVGQSFGHPSTASIDLGRSEWSVVPSRRRATSSTRSTIPRCGRALLDPAGPRRESRIPPSRLRLPHRRTGSHPHGSGSRQRRARVRRRLPAAPRADRPVGLQHLVAVPFFETQRRAAARDVALFGSEEAVLASITPCATCRASSSISSRLIRRRRRTFW